MSGTDRARRAVVVGGLRTPFAKAFGELMELDTIALGRPAAGALLRRLALPGREVEGIVWGGVILPPLSVNVGREIALDLGLTHVEGMTCTRACASGLQAVQLAAAAIERGEADVMVAGGSDSTSNAPVALPAKVTRALAPLALGRKAGLRDYADALRRLWPLRESLPRTPRIAERTTGEVMGESAERMARRNGISREAQDAFAARSHRRAARAIAEGRFDEEVIPVETPTGWVHSDGLVRADTSEEKLARLKPSFARDGSVTAGNSSPLTDGAAALVLMSEEKARALGHRPLAAFRAASQVAVDPADQLLIGPALAVPRVLERAGMTLADVDLVDLHEAFAAQMLSVLQALASKGFARERLGRDEAVGELDPERLNVHGGSLAIGHPFGATGARMATTMSYELARGTARTALLGLCAAGGLGTAAVLERVD